MFIIEANTFGEREDAAAYFIEGDREELELFRFYTLSLALSAMIGPKETRKLHENLRSPKEGCRSLIGPGSNDSCAYLCANGQGPIDVRQADARLQSASFPGNQGNVLFSDDLCRRQPWR